MSDNAEMRPHPYPHPRRRSTDIDDDNGNGNGDSNGSGSGNGSTKIVVRMARFYEKGFWVSITIICMLIGSFFVNGASKRDIDDKIAAHSEKTAEQLAAIRQQIEMVIRRQDRVIENVESTNVAVGKLQTQVDRMSRR